MASTRILVGCALVGLCLLVSGCERELGGECSILSAPDITELVVETKNWYCASEICVGTSEEAYCSKRCETDADCGAGMHCEDLTFTALVEDWICMYD